ncbi:MAG: nucleoside triphosphate pyrophosphohydrolase family protein [Burkholderiaceae bacterium]
MKLRESNFRQVETFMKACDQEVKNYPGFPADETVTLRLLLIHEEVHELVEAIRDENIVEVADALTDILYVVYGAGHAFGIDLDSCFSEVQRSNMTKVMPNGKVQKNSEGKVMKPETYSEPNLQQVLLNQDIKF